MSKWAIEGCKDSRVAFCLVCLLWSVPYLYQVTSALLLWARRCGSDEVEEVSCLVSTYKISSVFGSKGKSGFAVIFWKLEVSCEVFMQAYL